MGLYEQTKEEFNKLIALINNEKAELQKISDEIAIKLNYIENEKKIIEKEKEYYKKRLMELEEYNNYLNKKEQYIEKEKAFIESEKKRLDISDIDEIDEYKKVKNAINDGEQVIFVTGKAGTGKTTLIRYLRAKLKEPPVVLAFTGVAALNIEGMTIHSFFNLPWGPLDAKELKINKNNEYKSIKLIIIDEISMVRCDLLDCIDMTLRLNREDDRPFGGVQVLMIGDLYQLQPIAKEKKENPEENPEKDWNILKKLGYKSRYFFDSFVMQNLQFKTIELTHCFRHNNKEFINLLNLIRIGEEIKKTINEINKQCYLNDGFKTNITLTCTNNDADKINDEELKRLPGKTLLFKGVIIGKFLPDEKLPSPRILKLKVGAKVMFTKNDEQKRWVNGTLGIIKKINKKEIWVEIIEEYDHKLYKVLPVEWENYKYSFDKKNKRIEREKIGSYIQFPLMLAWAVTIHKSQGKTLDKVTIDFGRCAFAYGQVYVALSRCRTLQGIRLKRPLYESDIKYDPKIKEFYKKIEEAKN